MKTATQLRTLVERAGGRLEEDEAGSMTDTRIFQICAPEGKLWVNTDLHTMVCYWARGNSNHAYKHNEDAYADVEQRISGGLRDMTGEESELYVQD